MIDTEEIEDMVREIRRKEREDSNLPVFLTKADTRPKESRLVVNEKRSDGRKAEDHRRMFVQLGTVSEARGSCYIELGTTKVIASVRGPKEIPNIQEYTELCVLECLVEIAPFALSSGSGESSEQFISESLRLALEPVLCRHEFPNLQITVSAFVLEDGGSALSAAITAAGLALVHARLPCFGIVSSVTVGIYEDLVLVDPSHEEEEKCTFPTNSRHGLITMAYMKTNDQITLYHFVGCSDFNIFGRTMNTLKEKCISLDKLCSQYLMKEVKTSLKYLLQVKETQDAMMDLTVESPRKEAVTN